MTRWSGCGRSPRSAICGSPTSPGRSSTPEARGGPATRKDHATPVGHVAAEMVQPGGKRRAEPPEGLGPRRPGAGACWRLGAVWAALFLDVLFDYLLGRDRVTWA